MDNNFVNIDDLVRQRLGGGGEEQERSGAWLNMRELLDKEMPRQAGFIYWRRMLSALAVLLLIATISVGGYELSANRNGNDTGNIDAVATTVSAKSTPPIAIGAPVANSEVNNDNITSSGITANNGLAKTNDQNNLPTGQTDKKMVAANPKRIPSDNHLINKQKHLTSTQQKGSNNIGAGNTAQNNDHLPVAANAPADKSASHSKASNKEKTKELASAGTVGDNKMNTTHSAQKIPIAIGIVSPVGKPVSDNKPVVGSVKNTNRKTAGSTIKTGKEVKMKELALASHPLSVSHPKVAASAIPIVAIGTGVIPVASKTPDNKLPLNSHSISGKKKNGLAANSVKADPTKVLLVKNDKKIAGSKTPGAASAMANGQKPVAANLNKTVKAKPGVAANNAVEKAAKDATAANEKKEKRVIQKLVLYEQEHYIKTDPGNGYFTLDTISMKPIMQELAVAEENNPAPPAEKMLAERKAAPAANNIPANNSIASNGNSSGSTSATIEPQILPGASASSNGKPAMGQKDNSTGTKSTGAGALGSLESTFNDIKYNVKGVQFAAGLTAGINGTFFGPSSFNGFQFGVTGDFAFSNEWSFATELKYFQRANNNYSLNDNYTTYTQNPGGSYTMIQTTNSYTFTALHSIEMPLILRYTNGKFNFFVGGNLVYSFSINEGPTQEKSITPATAMGNDTQPKIDPVTDFNSRFGVGCLFGISYKIAPNFNVDLRNVMTLWDDANTSGAKYVSDQVYKSPSLQLSVGYRLGNNKQKE